jgi:predicted nucleic acid-binding Zn ribbon protein
MINIYVYGDKAQKKNKSKNKNFSMIFYLIASISFDIYVM